MTPEEVKAWDDHIRQWTSNRLPSFRQVREAEQQMFKNLNITKVVKPFCCFDCSEPITDERHKGVYICPKCGVGYQNEIVEKHFRQQSKKPFLTAADIVMLREMHIGL